MLLLSIAVILCGETVSLRPGDNSVSVLASTPGETILQYQVHSFERSPVQIDGQEWHHIRLPQEGFTQDKGYPELPVFNRSIIIDGTALMNLQIYDVEYQDLALAVAPSKGVITRDQDPQSIPYTFADIYRSQEFYPAQVAELSEPYILRDYRGITVKTVPFAYNPQTKVLRVFTNYKVRVFAEGTDSVNTMQASRTAISREFAPIYANHFANWENSRYTPVSDVPGKLLVVCHTNYMDTILPYVNWKKQKGIATELVQWSTIGTTATQLKTYIQNRYNADNSLTFVQLAGDYPQIPSLSSGGGGSDPSFSLVAGSDNYPDIFIGRFSAELSAQLTAQTNKAIVYERDLNTSATWLNRAMGLASAEGGGSQGDMGESDIAHMNLIRTDLLNYGYTSVDQIYDPGASASTVTTNVNAGRGFINYVGHGSNTSWVTTGFNNSNASALTNGNKTPFIMDVACVNGNFVSITCFAEAWLRNANGGAVAMYASSINQSWNSPMRAQDETTDLLVAESKTTIGGLFYNGSCKMMDIYGSGASSDGTKMFKTWHIFGDASLVVRSKTPLAMAVSHPAQIPIGATSVAVSTGVANALAAITHNNAILGSGFTDSSGSVTLTLVNPPGGEVSYTLTVTAFNRVTYVGTIQQVASEPEIAVTPGSLDFGVVNVGSSGLRQFTIQNTGNAALTGSITTPAGFTVAAATRSGDHRNTLNFSIAAESSAIYDLTFTPSQGSSYNGNLAISSNDSSEPAVNIALTASGNNIPAIVLPESFSFDVGCCLVVDFAPYIYDPDSQTLTLDCEGNCNVQASIDGLTVSFSVVECWCGCEEVCISVSDGYSEGSDTAQILVRAPYLYARCKAFLQGPYLAGGSMKHDLSAQLPLVSPYNANHSVTALPNVNNHYIVDWVYLQLRASANGPAEQSRSAFLLEDGTLVDLSGQAYISFDHTSGTDYYMILRHRNHLGIMSAAAHSFALASSAAPLIDLSLLDSVYGGNQAGVKQIEPGVLALISGDADQDGGVMPTDLNLYWRPQAGMSGYRSGDFDLSGTVLPTDLNLHWRPNTGLQSQIPAEAPPTKASP